MADELNDAVSSLLSHPHQGFSTHLNLTALPKQDEHMSGDQFFSRRHDGGFQLLIEYLNLFVIPVIVVLGVSGNAVSLLVFSSTYLRFRSSSVYLAMLAMTDASFLLCVFLVWLSRVNVPLFHHSYVCQAVVYLMYVLCFTSSWVVVAFTAERYVLLYYPLFKDRYCTRRMACWVCVALTLTACACYLIIFWTNGVNHINHVPICMPLPEYYDVITVLTGLDMTLTFIIPAVFIIIFNVKILIKIRQKRLHGEYVATWCVEFPVEGSTGSTPRRRPCYQTSISRSGRMHVTFLSRTLESPFNKTTCENDQGVELKASCTYDQGLDCVRKRFVQRRTARLLLLASSVFLLLNSPSYILRIKTFLSEIIHDDDPPKHELQWKELFQIVYFLNFAVDFIVYSACSGTFRAAIKRLLSRYQKKNAQHSSNSA